MAVGVGEAFQTGIACDFQNPRHSLHEVGSGGRLIHVEFAAFVIQHADGAKHADGVIHPGAANIGIAVFRCHIFELDDVKQHLRHFAAGDDALGAEGAVGIAVDVFDQRLFQLPAGFSVRRDIDDVAAGAAPFFRHHHRADGVAVDGGGSDVRGADAHNGHKTGFIHGGHGLIGGGPDDLCVFVRGIDGHIQLHVCVAGIGGDHSLAHGHIARLDGLFNDYHGAGGVAIDGGGGNVGGAQTLDGHEAVFVHGGHSVVGRGPDDLCIRIGGVDGGRQLHGCSVRISIDHGLVQGHLAGLNGLFFNIDHTNRCAIERRGSYVRASSAKNGYKTILAHLGYRLIGGSPRNNRGDRQSRIIRYRQPHRLCIRIHINLIGIETDFRNVHGAGCRTGSCRSRDHGCAVVQQGHSAVFINSGNRGITGFPVDLRIGHSRRQRRVEFNGAAHQRRSCHGLVQLQRSRTDDVNVIQFRVGGRTGRETPCTVANVDIVSIYEQIVGEGISIACRLCRSLLPELQTNYIALFQKLHIIPGRLRSGAEQIIDYIFDNLAVIVDAKMRSVIVNVAHQRLVVRGVLSELDTGEAPIAYVQIQRLVFRAGIGMQRHTEFKPQQIAILNRHLQIDVTCVGYMLQKLVAALVNDLCQHAGIAKNIIGGILAHGVVFKILRQHRNATVCARDLTDHSDVVQFIIRLVAAGHIAHHAQAQFCFTHEVSIAEHLVLKIGRLRSAALPKFHMHGIAAHQELDGIPRCRGATFKHIVDQLTFLNAVGPDL